MILKRLRWRSNRNWETDCWKGISFEGSVANFDQYDVLLCWECSEFLVSKGFEAIFTHSSSYRGLQVKCGCTIKTCLHSRIWLKALSLNTGLCENRLGIEITHTFAWSLNDHCRATGWVYGLERVLSVFLAVMAFLLVIRMLQISNKCTFLLNNLTVDCTCFHKFQKFHKFSFKNVLFSHFLNLFIYFLQSSVSQTRPQRPERIYVFWPYTLTG